MTINCASWFGDTSYGFCYELYGEKGVSNMPEKHCESEFSKDVLAEYAQSSFGLQDIARPMSCDGLRETFEYVKEGLKGTDNVKEEPMEDAKEELFFRISPSECVGVGAWADKGSPRIESYTGENGDSYDSNES